MKLFKMLKMPLIIVVALLAVVGSVNAFNMQMTPEEAQDVICEDVLGGVDIVIENITTSKTAVGATNTVIVPANVARKYLAVVNDSDEAIYISIGEAAVLNEGIRLNANGGSFEMTGENMSFKAINGISTSGSKNATFEEGY